VVAANISQLRDPHGSPFRSFSSRVLVARDEFALVTHKASFEVVESVGFLPDVADRVGLDGDGASSEETGRVFGAGGAVGVEAFEFGVCGVFAEDVADRLDAHDPLIGVGRLGRGDVPGAGVMQVVPGAAHRLAWVSCVRPDEVEALGLDAGWMAQARNLAGKEKAERLDLVSVGLPGVELAEDLKHGGAGDADASDGRVFEPSWQRVGQAERLADDDRPKVVIQPRLSPSGSDGSRRCPRPCSEAFMMTGSRLVFSV
jgi:hypothetical protein